MKKKAMTDTALLVIEQDTIPDSPRNWDNLGKMVCWHSRYSLGDKHTHDSPRDFLMSLAVDYDESDRDLDELKDYELMEIIDPHIVILPLFLYDHSGITMNTTGFSCLWDSGQIGWIYATKEAFRNETGYTEEELFKGGKAKEMLRNEVKVYDQYLTGDVYGFTFAKIDTEKLGKYLELIGAERDDLSEDELNRFLTDKDSYWGFYGSNPVENGIAENIPKEYHHMFDALQ
ncbi:hypothetical protein P4V86_03655 [Brevibacillus laterosporus]|uniref:hypothetical protein n=1 Tax=Brevibacillus laterosporus TaxID=1465 RepID=UPI00035DFE27|nr:hypothetical protein [Brevibacillus laterosporus]ATO48612.1 hypothetical protein BrL25_05465 [Brevibacillus laterosporus DSM 25]MED2002454.1 hypothetical protein [Brevibacillus laterosporus]